MAVEVGAGDHARGPPVQPSSSAVRIMVGSSRWSRGPADRPSPTTTRRAGAAAWRASGEHGRVGDVEELGVADAGEVLTLQRAAFAEVAVAIGHPRIPPLLETLEQVRSALRDPDVVVLGVRDGARLVASVRVELAAPGTATLARLAVAPDRQGEGIAGRLVRAVHERAAGREVLLLTGEHQVAALRLYARLGYVEVSRTRASAPPAAPDHDLVHLRRPA